MCAPQGGEPQGLSEEGPSATLPLADHLSTGVDASGRLASIRLAESGANSRMLNGGPAEVDLPAVLSGDLARRLRRAPPGRVVPSRLPASSGSHRRGAPAPLHLLPGPSSRVYNLLHEPLPVRTRSAHASFPLVPQGSYRQRARPPLQLR